MNFYEKIQEMDYEIKTKNENCIVIEKKRNISDLTIIFDIPNKSLTGYLKPNNILKTLDDISYQYAIFRELQIDLKELASLSKYQLL
ncbi:MAG: hypothetical protein K5765_06620 [Clostridia bacterium]|nr:hypothetical protein [Clostridia bacterium]